MPEYFKYKNMKEYSFMKNKFVLLDRDGVINVEKSYLYKIEDFEYEKNVVEGLLKFRL